MIEWATNQTCQWEAFTTDEFGSKAFSDPVTLDCRVEQTLQKVRTPAGDLVVSPGKVYFAPATGLPVSVGDRITIDGHAHQVALVKKRYGLDELDHILVFLGG